MAVICACIYTHTCTHICMCVLQGNSNKPFLHFGPLPKMSQLAVADVPVKFETVFEGTPPIHQHHPIKT